MTQHPLFYHNRYRFKFYETNSRNVPVRASLLALAVAFPFLFIPSLDVIATVVTMIFLLNYTAVNATCALMSILRLHSWRPKFRYEICLSVFVCLRFQKAPA